MGTHCSGLLDTICDIMDTLIYINLTTKYHALQCPALSEASCSCTKTQYQRSLIDHILFARWIKHVAYVLHEYEAAFRAPSEPRLVQVRRCHCSRSVSVIQEHVAYAYVSTDCLSVETAMVSD
jgi:hypothetical protein